MRRAASGLVIAAVGLCLAACAKEVPIVEVAGSCADVFGAQVCTWSHMKGDSVIDVGATVPLASITGAPMGEGPMTWPPKPLAALAIPEGAVAASGLREFTMLWEPTGHPPAPFMTPHFDFHFYVVPNDARMAISCADTTKPSTLADGYVLPDMDLPPDMAAALGTPKLVGVCIPEMGMHSLRASELADSMPFRGSMVLGYYAGKPIFVEPMISRAMLEEKQSFAQTVPAVPGMAGNYPAAMQATWDSTTQAYRFTFSEFRAGD